MTPVEVIAMALAVLLLVKLFLVFVLPDVRRDAVAKVYAHPMVLSIVSLVLAGIVLSYLFEELTIVQIFAVCAFFALLFAVSFAPFGKEMLQIVAKTRQTQILKRMWLAIVLWVGLAVWVLFELYR